MASERKTKDIITSAKEVMFLPDFVCLSVSKITQKFMDGSFWNFDGVSGMVQATSGSILGVIRKESWILDHFEIFVIIAFNGAYWKPLQNRRWCCHLANNIVLAEVCGLWLHFITRESRMLRASLPSSGRPSVCLSVCHTRELYQNGAS